MSLVLVAGIVCAFASCGGKGDADTTTDGTTNAAATSDLAYIKDKGTMIIGVTEYEPMNYKDEDGNWVAYSCDNCPNAENC
jgi:polar amino acid transport system substrate-binding protein